MTGGTSRRMCAAWRRGFHAYTSLISPINSKRCCLILSVGNPSLQSGMYLIGRYAKNPMLTLHPRACAGREAPAEPPKSDVAIFPSPRPSVKTDETLVRHSKWRIERARERRPLGRHGTEMSRHGICTYKECLVSTTQREGALPRRDCL